MRKLRRLKYLPIGAFLTVYFLLILWGWLDIFPRQWREVPPRTIVSQYYPPSVAHPLGIFFQKDLLISFVKSAPSSFVAGTITLLPFLVFGILLGVGSSMKQGSLQQLCHRLIEIMNAFPKLVVLLIYAALFGVNIYSLLILFGIISAPKLAELIRGKILELKREDFIDATIALGLPIRTIVFKHILWYHGRNIVASQIFYIFAMAVLMEASLSYLNLGIRYGYYSWGLMLHYATSVGHLSFFRWPWHPDFNLPAVLPSVGLIGLTYCLMYISRLIQEREMQMKGIL
ncbi:MAG: hypothetical protein GXO78_05750 [Calditrichaeota bacterium]|nr:hypothetical protein [Calditrichota bacterium]